MESSSSFLNVVKAKKRSDPKKRERAGSLDDDKKKTSPFDALDRFEREYFHLPLQSFARHVPGMRTLMTSFGASCTGEGLVCGFALLCWAISVNACICGIWLVPVVEVLNGLIKWQFGRPRPGWNDPRVEIRSTSHEYSFPSSHAMLSWSLSTFFANYWWENGSTSVFLFNVPLPICLLYGMATCVAISRVFDGAHYPHDIVVGGLLGRQVGLLHFTVVLPYFQLRALEMSTLHVVVSGLCMAAFMLLCTKICYSIAVQRFGNPPKKWCLLAKVKNDDLQPHFVPLFDYVGMCGVFAGLSVTVPVCDAQHPGLVLPTSIASGGFRLVVGLTILISAWFAVRGVEKSMATSTWLRLCLRFCRYAQVPPIILMVVPPCFEALGV